METLERTKIRECKVNSLASLIDYDDITVVSRPILMNNNGGIFILAFRQGQKLAQHQAPADVMIQAIEGRVEFTLDTTPMTLHAGDFILLPTGKLHSVKALTDCKLLLTKITR